MIKLLEWSIEVYSSDLMKIKLWSGNEENNNTRAIRDATLRHAVITIKEEHIIIRSPYLMNEASWWTSMRICMHQVCSWQIMFIMLIIP